MSLWELNGGRMETFGAKELVLAVLLQAGKPFSFYLAKVIMMLLLGGCNTVMYPALIAGVVLALIVLKLKHKGRN